MGEFGGFLSIFSPLKIANGFTVFKMLFKLFLVLFLS